MGKKCGQQSINFSQPPVITSGANIVGPEEGEGPLASGFDWILDDPLFGEKSWEMAECKMLEESAKLAPLYAEMHQEPSPVHAPRPKIFFQRPTTNH
jgi:hypothetical protein